MGKNTILFLIFGNVIFVCMFVFLYSSWYEKTHFVSYQEVRENANYTFVNPLLECNTDTDSYNPREIKDKIKRYIDASILKGDIMDVAYYVRLLNSGANF